MKSIKGFDLEKIKIDIIQIQNILEKCNKETLEYFKGLSEGKEFALKRKNEILKKLKELDSNSLLKEVESLIKDI